MLMLTGEEASWCSRRKSAGRRTLVFFAVVNEPSHLFELVNWQKARRVKAFFEAESYSPLRVSQLQALNFDEGRCKPATRRPCSPPSARAIQIEKSMDERDACYFNLILCIMMLSKLCQIPVHIFIKMLLKYNNKQRYIHKVLKK
jgi:hypothetical protein